MSQTALSVTAAFLPLNRISNCTKQWRRMFVSNSRQFGAGLSSSQSDCRRIVALSSTGPSGGVAEVSEGETASWCFTWPDKKKPRVCILGGGFGGLYTALKLESLAWPDDNKPQVVLVDQSERFVFKPMLYELLSGEVDKWEIAPRFSDLLGNTGVQFFQDRVKLLLPTDHLGMVGPTSTNCGGTVRLESGVSIEYDWLVLALGAEAKMDLVPGAAEFALPFSTLDDATAVDSRLRTLEQINFGKDTLIRVTIVGCGYSGIELAATVSERLQDRGIVQAINVGTTILPNALPGNREVALKVLSSRKIELLLGYFVRCIRKAENMGDLEDSTENGTLQNVVPKRGTERCILELQPAEKGLHSQLLETDIVLWTVGSKPPLLQLEASNDSHELPLNARGQAETDETLRVKGHPRIFALGDSSALRDSKGRLLPATAQVALQQADFAAWNIWAAINDRPLLPFRFQDLGETMTLGRHAAAVSPSFLEGLTLEGPLGHTARKLAYLLRLPTEEHRFKVGMSWLTKSAVDTVAQLQNTIAKVLSGS